MIPFLKYLNTEIRKLCKESYLNENTNKTISYPYLTYSLQEEDLEDREGIYIDIDIYDNKGADVTKLEELTHAIKMHFKRFNIVTKDFGVIIIYQNSRTVPTLSESIKHKSIELYARLDWRE